MNTLLSIFAALTLLGVIINGLVGEWGNVAGGMAVFAAIFSFLMWKETR